MTDLIAKMEAFAVTVETDVDTLFEEFVAFVEGKKAVLATNESGETVVEPVTEAAPVVAATETEVPQEVAPIA